jgi:hypothetical protein
VAEVASYDAAGKPIVATHSGRTGRRVDRVVAAHPCNASPAAGRATDIIHAVTDPAGSVALSLRQDRLPQNFLRDPLMPVGRLVHVSQNGRPRCSAVASRTPRLQTLRTICGERS